MNLHSTLATALTLGFGLTLGFTACEDVPAPYEVPTTPVNPSASETLIDESFSTQLGSFTNYTTAGSGAWKIDYKTAKASGYDNTSQKTTAGTYYLVGPEVDLTDIDAAYISFNYILRYNKGAENQQLLISDKFDTTQPAEGWTLLNQSWTEGRDWTTFSSYALNIPKEWLGKKVRIALKYNTDAVSGSTWEVKNLKMKKGTVSDVPSTPGTPTPDPINPPTGTNLLSNGGFETWTSASAPDHWTTTSGAGSASLSKSATAHGGSAAVLVAGAEQNKRLASENLTLKAGTYTMFFYARGEKDGASCRPGYVAVLDDGKADSKNYVYGDYVNDLKASAWTPVSYTFKLAAQTTVNLVVMNPKSKGNLLVDDFMLTTADGGIVSSGGNDTPGTPSTGAIYSKSLLDNADGWTLNEGGNIPAEVKAVWKQSTQYGLVATAYVSSTKQRYASEAWAISPEVKLTANNTLTFDHAANYFNDANLAETLLLYIREGDTAAWQPLTIPTMASGKNFTYVSSGAINLAAYAGKTVQFGFKYTSTATTAGTWEIKNVEVK